MWLTHSIRRSLAKPFGLPLSTHWTQFATTFCATAVRQAQVTLGMTDDLTRLAAKYKSDKGVTVFPFHGYSIHYDRLFRPLRDRPITILEIGLARRSDRETLTVECPSLSMWLDYFPSATVCGFDIDDFSGVRIPRTRIFRGDQGNREDLLKVVQEHPVLDIVIDDGSHASYHQQVTLSTLFPHLAIGGMYVIEDLMWQPEDLESTLPPVPKTLSLLEDPVALGKLIPSGQDVQLLASPIQEGKKGLAVITKKP